MNLVGPLKDVGKQAQGFFRFVHACTHQPAVLGAKTSAGWNPGVYNRGYLSHFYKTPIWRGPSREDEQTYLYVFRWYFLSLIMWGARERMAIRRIFPALRIFSEGTWVLIRWEEKKGKESLRKGVDPVNS